MGDIDKNQASGNAIAPNQAVGNDGAAKKSSGGKFAVGLVAVAALAAAAWVGGWFFVKGKIPQAVAQQTAALKAQGLDVTHGPITVKGFPFRHDARIENVVVNAVEPQAGLPVKAVTTIPWVEGSWAMFSPSKGRLTGVAETSKVDLTIGERTYSGDLKVTNLRGALDGSNPAAAAYDLAADGLSLDLAGAASDAADAEPGLRGLATKTGALTLKGSSGSAGTSFETILADLATTVRSEIPNPDFRVGGLIPNVTALEAATLTTRGSRDGEARRGETLLPPVLTIRTKTGEAPETVVPLNATNARISFTETPQRIDFLASGDALSYAMTQNEGPLTLVSDSRYGKFSFKGYLDKATLAAFEAADFANGAVPDVSRINARLEYTTADSAVAMKATRNEAAEPDPFSAMPPLPPFDLQVSSGPGDGVLAVENGRFDVSGFSRANVFSFSGPVQVSGEVGNLVVKLQGPLAAAEAAQPFAVEYDLDKVTLNEGAWDLIDPAGALDRQLNRLRVALSGDVILNASLGDQAAVERAAEEGKPPFAPGVVKIEDVTVDALGLVAKATGEGAFDPQNPMAPPQGEALISLKGWQAFAQSLIDAGHLPPMALQEAEGMVEMFGAPGEADGETVFRIVSNASELSVNGNSLNALLGVPQAPGGGSGEDWPLADPEGREFPFDREEGDLEVEEISPLAPPFEATPAEPAEAAPAEPAEPAAPAEPAEAAPTELQQLQEGVEGDLQRLEQGVEGAAEGVQEGVEGAAEDVRQEVEGGVQQLEEGVEGAVEGLQQEGEGALQRLEQGAEGVQQEVEGAAERLRQEADHGLQQLQEGVDQMREGLPSVDRLEQGAGEAVRQLQDEVEGGAERLRQGVEEGAQELRDGAQEGIERLEQELAPTPAPHHEPNAAPAEAEPAVPAPHHEPNDPAPAQ